MPESGLGVNPETGGLWHWVYGWMRQIGADGTFRLTVQFEAVRYTLKIKIAGAEISLPTSKSGIMSDFSNSFFRV